MAATARHATSRQNVPTPDPAPPPPAAPAPRRGVSARRASRPPGAERELRATGRGEDRAHPQLPAPPASLRGGEGGHGEKREAGAERAEARPRHEPGCLDD